MSRPTGLGGVRGPAEGTALPPPRRPSRATEHPREGSAPGLSRCLFRAQPAAVALVWCLPGMSGPILRGCAGTRHSNRLRQAGRQRPAPTHCHLPALCVRTSSFICLGADWASRGPAEGIPGDPPSLSPSQVALIIKFTFKMVRPLTAGGFLHLNQIEGRLGGSVGEAAAMTAQVMISRSWD